MWIEDEVQNFMRTGDEARFLKVLRAEARHARAGMDVMLRSHDGEDASSPATTMVLAFGGLQQQIGGGQAGGVPPFEFVRSCRKAGARHALFLRDPTRCWYCRGLGEGEGGHSFEAMVEVLRREVAAIRPSRLVTIGSSMGGYASVRAGLALNAHVAVSFSPQVLLDPDERRAAGLRHAPIDANLSWLKIVAACEGVSCTSLVDVVRVAPAACRTQIEVHVGALDRDDVREAHLLRDAVQERAHCGPSLSLTVHRGREHNLVVAMRDAGELHARLRSWLEVPLCPAEPSDAKAVQDAAEGSVRIPLNSSPQGAPDGTSMSILQVGACRGSIQRLHASRGASAAAGSWRRRQLHDQQRL